MTSKQKSLIALAAALLFAVPFFYGRHLELLNRKATYTALCGVVSANRSAPYTDECRFRFERWSSCRVKAADSADESGNTVEGWCEQNAFTEHFVAVLDGEELKAERRAIGNPGGWYLFAFFF